VPAQDLQPALDVVVVVPAPGVEVLAGHGDLQPVVSPAGRQLGDLLERQVGPLAREEREALAHVSLLR
jgi:hypothetical protein